MNRLKLINEEMRNMTSVRETFKRRTELIEANQKRRAEESILQAEASEVKRLERLEGYSKKIIYFGLWQSAPNSIKHFHWLMELF